MSDPDYIPPEVCLDKCKCGATGKFCITGTGWVFPAKHRAVCYECGYATGCHPKQFLAMVEWNKRQRGV